MLPTTRARRGVDFIASDRQKPPGYETGFWGPLDFYHVQSAAAGTDEKTLASPPTGLNYPPYCVDKHDLSMQHSELEAAPSALELEALLNQHHELESQYSPLNTMTSSTQRAALDFQSYEPNYPTSSGRRRELESLPIHENSELQGGQVGTESWESMVPLPSYTQVQTAWPLNQHSTIDDDFQPLASMDATVTLAFNASSSIADSPPRYNSSAQLYGPPFQPLDSVPTGFTTARHEGSYSTLAINTASAQQLPPFDQSSYHISRSFLKSPQMDHGQERVMTNADRIEGQSDRETLRWHNVPKTDPLADPSYVVTRKYLQTPPAAELEWACLGGPSNRSMSMEHLGRAELPSPDPFLPQLVSPGLGLMRSESSVPKPLSRLSTLDRNIVSELTTRDYTLASQELPHELATSNRNSRVRPLSYREDSLNSVIISPNNSASIRLRFRERKDSSDTIPTQASPSTKRPSFRLGPRRQNSRPHHIRLNSLSSLDTFQDRWDQSVPTLPGGNTPSSQPTHPMEPHGAGGNSSRNARGYPECSKSQGVLQENAYQQQTSPISPPAPSDSTTSPSSLILSPLSSKGKRGLHQINSNHGQTSLMTPHGSFSPPSSSSSSDRSSDKTSVLSSGTAPTPTEGSPMASRKQSAFQDTARLQNPKTIGEGQCPDCLEKFKGKSQDRKHNTKRHQAYACPARQGPRERFGCEIEGCNKDYSRPDILATHRQKEHPVAPARLHSHAHKVTRNF
ncbi:MAG: hypothetical protein L6R42_004174 [Xanthoria sp. 1 TBL-2021]|nr:MAG: hypothetical protein L6R42_004174 [Xanthoria sp. 1 TBL-2021]